LNVSRPRQQDHLHVKTIYVTPRRFDQLPLPRKQQKQSNRRFDNFTSNETIGYNVIQSLDVDYVLIKYGGIAGIGSDDLNKFGWIIKITSGVFPALCNASNFFLPNGQLNLLQPTAQMKKSLMYKLSYYNMEKMGNKNREIGLDINRQNNLKNMSHISFQYLQEVYSTQNSIYRIYQIVPPSALQSLSHD